MHILINSPNIVEGITILGDSLVEHEGTTETAVWDCGLIVVSNLSPVGPNSNSVCLPSQILDAGPILSSDVR